ncbi:MAG: hypothetical protein ACR2MJ_06540 [Flavobacteriaceae bacterium]
MNYLEAILQKLVGQRAIEVQDLLVYLNNPVGVGEHSNIGEEVELKVDKIDSMNSKIETVEKLIKQLHQKQTNTKADQ